MEFKTLYKYTREDGGVTVSPVKPENKTVNYTEMYRLIADEDKMLTLDGATLYSCTDVENTDGWYEVDALVNPYLEVTG